MVWLHIAGLAEHWPDKGVRIRNKELQQYMDRVSNPNRATSEEMRNLHQWQTTGSRGREVWLATTSPRLYAWWVSSATGRTLKSWCFQKYADIYIYIYIHTHKYMHIYIYIPGNKWMHFTQPTWNVEHNVNYHWLGDGVSNMCLTIYGIWNENICNQLDTTLSLLCTVSWQADVTNTHLDWRHTQRRAFTH